MQVAIKIIFDQGNLAARQHHSPVGTRWRVDETLWKIGGRWRYVFRCLVTRAAEELNGAGDRIAVRRVDFTFDREGSPKNYALAMFRADRPGIDRIFDAGSESKRSNVWPSRWLAVFTPRIRKH